MAVAADDLVIDLDDVQSVILRPSGAACVDLRFVVLNSEADMRSFLRTASEVVTSAAEANALAAHRSVGKERRGALNVGVTGEGLRLAGLDERVYAALPSTFTRGMRAAASRLSDTGDGDPVHWHPPFDTSDPVHAVVLRYGDRDWAGLEPKPGDCVWSGKTRRCNTEPFCFRDNISNPVIEGSGKPLDPGNGVWDPQAQSWRPVRTGEALMGYVDESNAVAGHPDSAYVERNGSYFVIRKLEQHVKQFDDACKDWAKKLGTDSLTADEVAAQLVGRMRDGTPVGQVPAVPPAAPNNDFLYREPGAKGASIPPSSHIRRANPRDDMDFADKIVARHLLFRRGYPYEETRPRKSPEGGKVRGLLFMACCADLRRQFEFVQSHWLQDGNRFGLGTETDPIVGQRTTGEDTLSIWVNGQRERRPDMATFVTTRGGEYFLLPSLSALRVLGTEP